MNVQPERIPAPGRVLVLMYHGLHDGRDSPGHFDPRYSVTPADFRAQLEYLIEHHRAGWLPVAGEPLLAPPRLGEKDMVLVSFDDGDASWVDTALPILQETGLGALFFVTRDYVGRPGMISTGGLRKLSDAGMGIGSHGVTHRFLNTLSPAGLEFELANSRDFLEQVTGRTVSLLSLPGGRGGSREITAARGSGYRGVFGSEPGNNADTLSNGLIQRVPITREVTFETFRQVVDWTGSAAWRIRARHAALRWPKRLLGDRGYDWLRSAWVR
jgi:peptidoglycan/xylan/chitin deacetylase (PgdA/CDA1 family)